MRSKCLKEGTIFSGIPYANKTLPIRSFVSATTNVHCLLYEPLRHIAQFRYNRLSTSCGTIMSHWGHRGWGRLTPYRITMLSQACWWAKHTQRFVCEDADPRNPSTGYLNRKGFFAWTPYTVLWSLT